MSEPLGEEPSSSLSADIVDADLGQTSDKDGVVYDFYKKPLFSYLNSFLSYHPHKPEIFENRNNWNFDLIYKRKDGTGRNWISYNSATSSIYCWICIAFGNDKDCPFVLGTRPSVKHVYDRINKHEASQLHQNCSDAYFIRSQNQDISGFYFSKARAEHLKVVEKNRAILCRVVEIIKTIGKRGIAFRGNSEAEVAFSLENETLDHGNFLELLLLLSKFDPLLKNHIDQAIDISKKMHSLPSSTRGRGNITTFLSKTTVTKIIEVIGQLIKKKLSEEIQKSILFSIQVDTTQDINVVDQCSVVIRYISEYSVNEKLFAVINSTSSKGKNLHSMISDLLKDRHIEIKNCVGNSTDGAANMQGQYNGFTSWLSKDAPAQIHVWCYAHVLNLVIIDTSNKTLAAVNLFGLLNKCAVFFHESHKRMQVWTDIVKNKNRIINVIGETRWWSKDKALNKVFSDETTYVQLCETLYSMAHSQEFNSDVRFNANTFLDGFLKFENIVTGMMFITIFKKTTPLSLYLQTKGLDLLQSFKMVENTTSSLKSISRNFEEVFAKAQFFAKSANRYFDEKGLPFAAEIEFANKRVQKRKTFHGESIDNFQPTAKFKYCVEVYNITLDTIINSLESRFIKHRQFYLDFECFHPSTFPEIDKLPENALDDISHKLQQYNSNISKNALRNQLADFASKWDRFKISLADEYKTGQINNDEEAEGDRNGEMLTCDKSCKNCILCCYRFLVRYNMFATVYPDLAFAYKYLLTLSISQVACERSFSKLKFILNRLRSSLTQEHLEAFMLMSSENEILFNLKNEEIIDNFALTSKNLTNLLTIPK